MTREAALSAAHPKLLGRMATFTQNVDKFPAGTTVGAFRQSNWPFGSLPPVGAPLGSPDGSAVVATGGLLSIPNLADSTAYFLTNTSGTPGSMGYARHSSAATPAVAVASQLTEPWVMAHRGGGGNVSPDNALESLDLGVSYGYGIVDGGDLRFGADSSVLCCHDTTVDRTINASGNVSSESLFSWQTRTMKQFSPQWPATLRPPTFDQWLDRVKALNVVCTPEVKVTGNAALNSAVVAKIVRRGMQKQCVFQSFTLSDLAAAKAAGIKTMYLAQGAPGSAASIIAAAPDFYSFDYTNGATTDLLLQQLSAAGIKIVPWTVDSKADYAAVQARLAGIAVPMAGVVSNDPLWINGTTLPTFTTDNFTAGIVAPGNVLGGTSDRPTWTGSPNRRYFDGQTGLYQFECQGSMNKPGLVSLIVTVTFDVLDTTATRHADIVWGCVDDTPNIPSANIGYAAILRQNGSFELFKGPTNLATLATAAVVAGQAVQIKCEFVGTTVKATRMDTADVVSAVDSTFRGGYFHLGKQVQGATKGKYSFSGITVA